MNTNKQGYLSQVVRGGLLLGALVVSACSTSILLNSGPANLAPLDYVNWARSADDQAFANEQVRLQTLLDDGIATIPSLQFSILVGVQRDISESLLTEALVHAEPGSVACGLSSQCQSYMNFNGFWYDYLQQRQQLESTTVNLQDAQQQMMALEALVQGLRQQIEELTLIEQDIVEREQPLRQ